MYEASPSRILPSLFKSCLWGPNWPRQGVTGLQLGQVVKLVTCLTTDEHLPADPGVAWSYTLVELDHEIISTDILLPSADSFKKGCCQLQEKVYARISG